MAVNRSLRNLAQERNHSPVRRIEENYTPALNASQRQVKSGSQAQLFENNPFFGDFDYVTYQDSGYNEYEGLADPKVQKKSIREIKMVAAKSNPHMKAAMTDFQDYVVGGWGFKPNKSIVIDRFLDTMENQFEGYDAYLSDVTDSLFLYSAFFHESVYDDQKALRKVTCLDHNTAEFKQDKSHPLGDRYVLGQRIGFGNEGWIPLQDEPNYFYRKLYSKSNYPYGVPFVDAGIFHMVMMVEFFKAYRTLLESFVLPSLFFRVDREIVEKTITDPTERLGFVKKVFAELVKQVKRFKEGSARVVAMGSEVMDPILLSGMNDKTMGASEALINALDNQLELALKTHGLTTLRNDSALNDTKAKYRMANYSRIVKRGQNVITTPLKYQFKLAHLEVGSADESEFYLERSIYEDEQILAEISSVITQARSDGYDAMEKLMEVLDKAVEKGYVTVQQANQMFIDEMAKIGEQIELADPLA